MTHKIRHLKKQDKALAKVIDKVKLSPIQKEKTILESW